MQPNTETNLSQNVLLRTENQRLTSQNKNLLQKIKMLQKQVQQMVIEKGKSVSNQKQQVAPKKCDHGHTHNHGHGHGHSHGHSHNPHKESSSQQQNPSQPSNVPLPPVPKRPFLSQLFKTQQQIDFRYFRLPLKTIKAWKKDQGIELTKNKSCMLRNLSITKIDLRQMKLNLLQFVKQTWEQVQWINLPQCQIDDQGWRVIVDNAHKSFPDLRVIGIRWNQIKTIKQGDLEHFKELKMIDLGLQSQQNNPLSEESREVLRKYGQKNNTVKIQ